MKKKILFLIIALTAAFVISCQKKETPQGGAAPAVSGTESVQAASSSGQYGYVLRANSGFYKMEKDTGDETDKVEWSASMTLGEMVQITGEARRATYVASNGTSSVYSYLPIRRDNGNTGFGMAIQVAPAGQLAVVTDEKATLFRSPKAVDVSNVIVARKTVVVYYPESENGGFLQVRAYDPVKEFYVQPDNNYLRRTALSMKSDDVESVILLQTALLLTSDSQKVRREALLESAFFGYPGSVFYDEIHALVNPGAAAPAVSIKTEKVSPAYLLLVNDDNVNVRDMPSLIGKVVGTVSTGDSVTVTEQTTETYDIAGDKDRWYKITSPEGWVFGAFLSESE
jgi:uncharacterized protein YgiM (DUF1202 family)